MSGTYYNEIDESAAEWLRELIRRGLIADGEVDTRSIVDVGSDDIKSFAQCHFFAGIGVWSYALRQAGWDDDRPVWTGSCPCQPFSTAGKNKGIHDERHLWPHWFRLIRELNPTAILGEQSATKSALEWFDIVSTDLEISGYAVGAADLCAASVVQTHTRQRIWFVAERVADTLRKRQSGSGEVQRPINSATDTDRQASRFDYNPNGDNPPLGWVELADGTARPSVPELQPLVNGPAGGVGRRSKDRVPSDQRKMMLKGYGNAIVAPVAVEFISAYMLTL